MNTYTVNLRPYVHHALVGHRPPPLTTQTLTQALTDAGIRELNPTPAGGYLLDVELQGPEHDEALNQILLVAQQLGYELISATVSEWVDARVECALLGMIGGGGAGASSQQGSIALLAAAAGTFIGALAGSRIKRIERMYQVHRRYPHGWTLTPIQVQQPSTAYFEAGPSPA